MKGLDTSVLLALLEGHSAAVGLVKRLRGVELATSEANLLELTQIASQSPARSRAARRQALDRLRQKITVLPIDSRAVERVARHLSRDTELFPVSVLAMMGALEANGCDELFTQERPQDLGKWKFRVSVLGPNKTK